jgi:hypothetical protein
MSRTRILLTCFALLILAVWAAWWLDRSPSIAETTGRTTSEPTKEFATPAQSKLAAAAFEPAHPAIVASRELVASEPREAASKSPAPRDLHGKLVLIDLDGTEQTDAYGSLTWTRWVGVVPQYYQVPVVNGEWVVGGESLRGLRAISFKSVQVGLRRASIEGPAGLHRPPFDSEFVVRAHLLPSASLRVVDAERGVDLEGVSLIATEASSRRGCHPGIDFESRVLASGLRSPIRLEEPLFPRHRFGGSGPNALLVGAPGFAWTRFEIDFEQDGEQVVALERGADLALNVRGCDPTSRAHLRLQKGQEDYGELYVEVGLRADGCLRFSGLPGGPLRVAALIGSGLSQMALATHELDLRAGKLTEGTLELSPAPPLVLANASGTVLIPRDWEAKRLYLHLSLQDVPLGGFEPDRRARATAVPSRLEGFDAFSWSETDLQVGSYELELLKPGYVTAIEVPLGGLSGIDVIVPPPVELLVRVLDDATGLPLDSARVHWSQLAWRDTRIFGSSSAGESCDCDGTGACRIRAPAGEIQLSAWADEYRHHRERVVLSDGLRELTLRLQRACGFNLRLTDQGRPIPIPQEVSSHILGASDVVSCTMSTNDYVCGFGLREPGTFSFTLPGISGYEAIPPQVVAVQPGPFTELAIELTRKR